MELKIALKPAGTTTPREVAALSADVQETLLRHRQVERVAPLREAAPDGAKGIAEAIGAFLVALPPAAITGVFDVLKGLLVRSPSTPVTVEITVDTIKLSFDPRSATPAEMGELVAKLRPAGAG
jgi:hypothetical protein